MKLTDERGRELASVECGNCCRELGLNSFTDETVTFRPQVTASANSDNDAKAFWENLGREVIEMLMAQGFEPCGGTQTDNPLTYRKGMSEFDALSDTNSDATQTGENDG
jgi:hypothetical protein